MQYFEYEPSHFLSQYIEYYWILKAEKNWQSDLDGLRLPDHSAEWIFNLSDPGKSRITLKFKNSNVLVHEQPVELFGIRFRPWGLAKIGDINMREFKGVLNSLRPSLIFPDLTASLEEDILSGDSIPKKVRSVEKILKDRLSGSFPLDLITKRVARDIALANGNVLIRELCKAYNLSKTALNNKLVDDIGLSPKEFAKIHRFNFFLRKGVQEEKKTFTMLAQECGYYDQSHLNHEFKSLTGMTPSRFFSHSSSIIVRGSCTGTEQSLS